MSWRERHLRKVNRLEHAAAELVLRELDKALDAVASGFAAVTAAADDEPADAAGSPDDLAALGPQWAASVDGEILPWMGEVYREGGDAAVEQVTETTGRTVPPADPDLTNEAAVRHLAEARPRFVALGDTAWEQARAELVAGFAQGDDIGRMRRRLQTVTDLTRARADALARTEVIAAANAGSMSRVRLMPDEVRPQYKQWLSTMDARTRPSHVRADGQVVEREQKFSVGAASLDYPGDYTGPADEVINCRCTVLFVESPEALVVEGRQEGGIVDHTTVPPASAEPLVLEGGTLDVGVDWADATAEQVRSDLAGWAEKFRALHLQGTESRLQLDVPMSVASQAIDAAPPGVVITVGYEAVVKARWRDAAGALVAEVVPISDLASTAASSWSPPPDAYCIEEGCREPATTRRPLTDNIDELVCARHLRESADLGHPTTDSVTGEKHTGSMIALVPSEEDAERLALEGGESARQLHVTLWFLGEASDIPPALQEGIVQEVEARSAEFEPLQVNIFGASIWNPNGERGGSLNWNVGGPADLEDIREEMRAGLLSAPGLIEDDEEAAAAAEWEMAENHSPWAAHMCAKYAPTDDLAGALPAALERVGEVTLDRVRVTFGGQVIDIPLGASQDGASQEDMTMGETADSTDAAFPKPPPGKRAKKGAGGQCPPGFRPDGDDCVSTATPSKDDDDAAAGEAPATKCPPGQQMIDGECVPMEQAEGLRPANLQPSPGDHFHALMHRQGVSTGRRTFKNLTWREPPFSYHWQKSSSAHGGTPAVVQVGLVGRVVEDGPDLHAFGHLDLDSEDGFEYARRLVQGYERWVSIGLDEQPSNIEVVWPDVEDDDADGPSPLVEPEQVIFDGGCVGELTGVSVPAQADAFAEPTAELVRLVEERLGTTVEPAEADVVTASVVGSTDLPVADRDTAWDGPGAKNRVFEWASSGDSVDTARIARAFLYRDPDADPDTKAAWGLGFADIIDGQLRIVPRGVAATAGGRGVNALSAPEDEKARMRSKICTLYGKVRAVHDDWADCPFDSSGASEAVGHAYANADAIQSITAAAWRIEVAEVAPRWWFDEPTDVDLTRAAFNITNEGRIFGVLAPLHTGHRAFAGSGRRLEVPFGNVDYDRFMGGWAVTSKGKIAAGPVTMDCGHADRLRPNHAVAPAHYDNACTVFGKIRVGENRANGYVWVAGALEPGVTPDEVSRALVCRCSGDWQPHPDRPGYQELIAALLVPSPGFASANRGASLSVGEEIEQDGVLVASSIHAEVPVRVAEPARPALRIDMSQRRVERIEEPA